MSEYVCGLVLILSACIGSLFYQHKDATHEAYTIADQIGRLLTEANGAFESMTKEPMLASQREKSREAEGEEREREGAPTPDTHTYDKQHLVPCCDFFFCMNAGLLTFRNMAILLRMNAMTRAIEQVFTKVRIPYTIIGGLKFFDRAEVKDCMAYLKLVHNPHDAVSLSRIINVPRRGVGDKLLQALDKAAEQWQCSMWSAIKRALRDQRAQRQVKMTSHAKAQLSSLVALVGRLKAKEAGDQKPSELLNAILNGVRYEAYLEEVHKGNKESKWENVTELIALAQEFECGRAGSTPPPHGEAMQGMGKTTACAKEEEDEGQGREQEQEEQEEEEEEEWVKKEQDEWRRGEKKKKKKKKKKRHAEGMVVVQHSSSSSSSSSRGEQPKGTESRKSPSLLAQNGKLQFKQEANVKDQESSDDDRGDGDGGSITSALDGFLEHVSLFASSDLSGAQGDSAKDTVTLCTIHAAKGMEWAVVFVPGVFARVNERERVCVCERASVRACERVSVCACAHLNTMCFRRRGVCHSTQQGSRGS